MKKLMLALALVVSVCNFAIGLTYAAICQGTGGARACGSQCVTVSEGQCGCAGECSKAERDWVAAGSGGGHEELEEVYDY